MLTERQTVVAEDLVSGELNRSAIAAKYGISRTLLYEWLHNPEFVELLNDLSKTAVEATRVAIKASTDRAFAELNKLLNSKSERTRLLAASTLLDRAGLSSEMCMKIGVTNESPPERLNVDDIRKRLQEKKEALQLPAKDGDL